MSSHVSILPIHPSIHPSIHLSIYPSIPSAPPASYLPLSYSSPFHTPHLRVPIHTSYNISKFIYCTCTSSAIYPYFLLPTPIYISCPCPCPCPRPRPRPRSCSCSCSCPIHVPTHTSNSIKIYVPYVLNHLSILPTRFRLHFCLLFICPYQTG